MCRRSNLPDLAARAQAAEDLLEAAAAGAATEAAAVVGEVEAVVGEVEAVAVVAVEARPLR